MRISDWSSDVFSCDLGYQETNVRANGNRPRDVFAAARKAAAAQVRGSDAARVTSLDQVFALALVKEGAHAPCPTSAASFDLTGAASCVVPPSQAFTLAIPASG